MDICDIGDGARYPTSLHSVRIGGVNPDPQGRLSGSGGLCGDQREPDPYRSRRVISAIPQPIGTALEALRFNVYDLDNGFGGDADALGYHTINGRQNDGLRYNTVREVSDENDVASAPLLTYSSACSSLSRDLPHRALGARRWSSPPQRDKFLGIGGTRTEHCCNEATRQTR
jgi:hypothetical protein